MNKLIHTPSGVRDIFGAEIERKAILMDKIGEIFSLYGYQIIQTPSVEFYPVFDKDKGTMHASRLFRMIDAEGHTLVLRPDFTPSIARAVSSYFANETLPIRLCYNGNVFLNNTNYRGRLNESTEMGVEFINCHLAEADAELIAMSVDIMKAAGLKDFQISVGNVAFFNALCLEAEINEDAVEEIRHLLSSRNHFGAIELIEGLDIDKKEKEALMVLPTLFGDETVLEKAAALTENSEALASLSRLKEVYDILKEYGCTEYVSFDLGMLSDYSYYTGIILQAVTYGSGDAVIKGGRYDRFIEKFGKKADAIGFTTLVDSLLSAVQRQKLETPLENDRIMILYSQGNAIKAVAEAKKYREQGRKVMCAALPDEDEMNAYIDNGRKNRCGQIVLIRDGRDPEIMEI